MALKARKHHRICNVGKYEIVLACLKTKGRKVEREQQADEKCRDGGAGAQILPLPCLPPICQFLKYSQKSKVWFVLEWKLMVKNGENSRDGGAGAQILPLSKCSTSTLLLSLLLYNLSSLDLLSWLMASRVFPRRFYLTLMLCSICGQLFAESSGLTTTTTSS